MRSATVVVELAWKRLRRRDSGALMAVLGLVVATAVLAGVLAGVTVAADRSTAQAIERVPASERSVRAAWFGIPGGSSEELDSLDDAVGNVFDDIGLEGPTPLVLFRESTIAGRFVGLTAADGVAEHVVLRSGRLPRECTPARCEVLRLRGRGALPNAPGLRLVQVGEASLTSRQLYGDFLLSDDAAVADATVPPELGQTAEYHRPAPPPLVVAEGREALAKAPVLARTYRTYAWVWPIAPGAPRLWDVERLVDRSERARLELTERSTSFGVDVPVEELREAERSAEVAGTRLLLVGGEGAALLLAFTILAARGMRRDLEAARRRLTWFGAQRWQLWMLTGVESGAVAFAGVVLGWIVGIGVGALVAAVAGAPVAAVLRESVLSPFGLVLAVAAAVVAALLVWITVSLPTREGARLGALDVALSLVAVIVVVALVGGAADEEQLARGEGPALLLLLMPGLVAIGAALAVARVFPVLARLRADRGSRRLASRLAAVGLARGPGAAVASVAFLTIAFAVALLAEGYRATLTRGDREQAAFAVPHDVVVRESLQNLVRVFDAAPIERFEALAGEGGAARPVLRITAGVGRAERVSGVTVLGLDRAAIEELGIWRDEWTDGRGRSELAALVETDAPAELRGLDLPDGRISFRVGPGLVSLAAVVRTPGGAFRRIELGEADARAATTLSAAAPAGSLLTSLEIVPPPRLIEGGADAGTGFVATVSLAGPQARRLRNWVSVGGSTIVETPAGVRVRVPLTLLRSSGLRAAQPTDAAPPAVLVTPRLAELAGGVGEVVPLQVGGGSVAVRVVGTVDRFPGTTDDVVIGDRVALGTAVNTASPGAARENEVWLEVAPERSGEVADGLVQSPFRVLEATVRADVEDEARRDPLAYGTLLALVGTAAVALLLAALGLTLAVRSELRDDSGEQFDLEAQGATPAFLRSVVRARAATVSAVGLVGGIMTGLALLLLVTRVVTVTARGGDAEPPLAVVVDPLLLACGVAAFGVVAALLVGAATRHAFAGERGPAYRETD
ncbi:MAG TPA: FtsX-like permease family protein [Gaiellaceae bacterium]|nr:FtsX-like permease family protein [Gaiellaceae bacterium]